MHKNQTVSSSLINSQSNLSIVGSFQVIQDVLTELTKKLNIDGFTIKEKFNCFWVFAKTKIKYFHDFHWNETMKINAFISSITNVKMCIDVEIKNQNNEIALYSRTELCALDLGEEKIQKLSSIGVADLLVSKHKAQDICFEKLNFSDLSKVCTIQNRYTNIDFCHHTNNTEYVRHIMNTYTVKEIEQKKIKEIEIVYINQSFENDNLDIYKNTCEDADCFELKIGEKSIVKCKILF